MPVQNFEYCSYHYLNQWLTHDRNYRLILNSNDKEKKLAALKKAGGFYRIARNLPREFDEKKGLVRYQPVLNILDLTSQDQFKENPIKKIREIQNKISKRYGNRNVLSLTTKFLWLKIKQPILNYNSRARIAVGSKNGDLDDYYIKWKNDFRKHLTRIEEICCKLPDLHMYVVDQEVGTKEYIKEVSSKPWFHERVFDIYLWNKGNNT